MTINAAALPPLSDAAFLAGVAIGLIGMLSLIFVKNVRYARRVYWLSWLVAGGLISLAALDRGVGSVCIAAAAAGSIACVYAYFRTSYIKINNRIYAYAIPNSRPDAPRDGSSPPPVSAPPPDSYRDFVTAPKLWWTHVVFVCAAAFLAWQVGVRAETLGMTILAGVMLSFTGYLDAREGFPIARRQFIQLALIAIASIPVFLAPLISYVLVYWARGGSFRLTYRDNDEA